MARTTAKAFDDYLRLIEPTSSQKEAVKNRVLTAQTLLQSTFSETSDLPFRSVKLMGSTDRSTATRPVDDLDVLLVFKNKDDVFEKLSLIHI